MELKEIIQIQLDTQHKFVLHLMSNATLITLKKRPATHQWNMLEHFAHLARYQTVFTERVNEILSQKNPQLPRYSAEIDPVFEHYRRKNISTLTEDLVHERAIISDRFKKLTAIQLKKTGEHPVFGKMTLIEWYEFFLLHEAHHAYAMFRLEKL